MASHSPDVILNVAVSPPIVTTSLASTPVTTTETSTPPSLAASAILITAPPPSTVTAPIAGAVTSAVNETAFVAVTELPAASAATTLKSLDPSETDAVGIVATHVSPLVFVAVSPPMVTEPPVSTPVTSTETTTPPSLAASAMLTTGVPSTVTAPITGEFASTRYTPASSIVPLLISVAGVIPPWSKTVAPFCKSKLVPVTVKSAISSMSPSAMT